jgi:hypothetical protein
MINVNAGMGIVSGTGRVKKADGTVVHFEVKSEPVSEKQSKKFINSQKVDENGSNTSR